MKKSAKILSIILALVMVLSVIPVAAFAEVKEVNISDTIYYTYDDETGVLTVKGTGAIPDYDEDTSGDFGYIYQISWIYISKNCHF